MAETPHTEATTGAQLYTTARSLRDRVVINVRGETDLSNIASFTGKLAEHATAPWLVCNMTEVAFCSVAGARVLEHAAIRAAATAQRFEVIAGHHVARLLAATRLADVITCAGDRDAIATVRR